MSVVCNCWLCREDGCWPLPSYQPRVRGGTHPGGGWMPGLAQTLWDVPLAMGPPVKTQIIVITVIIMINNSLQGTGMIVLAWKMVPSLDDNGSTAVCLQYWGPARGEAPGWVWMFRTCSLHWVTPTPAQAQPTSPCWESSPVNAPGSNSGRRREVGQPVASAECLLCTRLSNTLHLNKHYGMDKILFCG